MAFRHQHSGRVVSPEPGTAGHARCVRLPVWEPVDDPTPEPTPDDQPVHVGGGWYLYPDGTKVRGNPEEGD